MSIPAWARTVQDLIYAGASVRALCDDGGCQRGRDVDLERIKAARGPDFSLWNKRPRCPRCGKRTRFVYAASKNTPHRPMISG